MSTKTKKTAVDKAIQKEIKKDSNGGGGSGGGSNVGGSVGGGSAKTTSNKEHKDIVDIKTNQNQLFQNQLNSRIASNYEHDYRDVMMNYDKSKNITRPKLTQYEKALILGKRATQIANGANSTIDVKPGMTVREIAIEELKQKKIPYLIKRPIGNTFEYWKLADLYVNMN